MGIISPSTPDRWDRITNQTKWYNTMPIYKNPLDSVTAWPIKMIILNDPINNVVRFAQIDTSTNTELYSATFLSSFTATDQGMDIYIMTDGIGESFGIYDISVEQYLPTINPTLEPTIFPTISPTFEFVTTSSSTVNETLLTNTSQSVFSTSMIYESTEDMNVNSIKTNVHGFDDQVKEHMDLMMVSIISGICCGFYCLFATVILSCFCARSHCYRTRRRKGSKYKYEDSNMVIVYPKKNVCNVMQHHKYNKKKIQYQDSDDTSADYIESETETSSNV